MSRKREEEEGGSEAERSWSYQEPHVRMGGAPGIAFWDIALHPVIAWLGRRDDGTAKNGVLGRPDFSGPSLARTRRRWERQE